MDKRTGRRVLADLMQARGGAWATSTEERFGVDCVTKLTPGQIEALAAEPWGEQAEQEPDVQGLREQLADAVRSNPDGVM